VCSSDLRERAGDQFQPPKLAIAVARRDVRAPE